MANQQGGVGSKFISVNLNKSYGQHPSSSHHANHPPFSGSVSGSGSYAAVGRGRPGSAGGGGGGMVVLSRSRGLQKAVPKLSVPPPLNLPSLRKEHERLDLSGSGSGPNGGAGAGTGPRPSSSGMGWTKPVAPAPAPAPALPEKTDVHQVVDGVEHNGRVDVIGMKGSGTASSAYVPPSARSSGGVGVTVPSSAGVFPAPTMEKASVLRGEDFPTLRAALPVSTGPAKQKDGSLNQKQKQTVLNEEIPVEQRENQRLNTLVDMRPQGQAPPSVGNASVENGREGQGLGSSRVADQGRKQDDFFAGPLPLVRLNPRSDWADDERDTGHGILDRGRDHGYNKSEPYWDRDFDMPKPSVLPHKPVYSHYDRRGQRDNEAGNGFPGEVLKVDPYRREIRTPSREGRDGNMWRASTLANDALSVQEVVNDRSSVAAKTTGFKKEFANENKYIPPHFADGSRDGGVVGTRDLSSGKRDMGHASEGRQNWNNTVESYNLRGAERNTRAFSNEQNNRYKVDNFPANMSRTSFHSGGKPHPAADPVPTLGREKHAFSKSERPYVEDPFMKDYTSAGFDERDPFSGGLVGIIKRKKDVVKQVDFHDPVRESFEAELERVQKMQELERQKIIEEQERALEQARREEEERQRLIREEEERRRRAEEEAREAAWRAEQERLEAIRRAEEQRIAREEEKRRILMEEERRKQAARQKLLELEAKMAQKQVETAKGEPSVSAVVTDEKLTAPMKEIDVQGTADLDNWEDSERMVERLTTSASFDSSVMGRQFDLNSRSYPSREASSSSLDRVKPISSWRRSVFENGSGSNLPYQDQDIGHYSPGRDSASSGKAVPRSEFYGGSGYMSSRTYFKGGLQEQYMDEYGHQREQRWNPSGDADLYNRNRETDSDFSDNLAERYGDIGWGQGRARGNVRSPYPGRIYPYSETEGVYSQGRSRYSMKQPRVLPPPSFASMERASFRGMNEHPVPSTFLDSDDRYSQTARSVSASQGGYYNGHQEGLESSEPVEVHEETAAYEDEKVNKDMSRLCDSQSSLSVSSPPNTPPHLSHDELDESGDSPLLSTAAKFTKHAISGNDSVVMNESCAQDTMMTASSSISAIDDEEWGLDNNNRLQQQEEYDEDEDGYQEEDEIREGDDENLDINEEFEHLQLEEKEPSHLTDNLVLGFDDGVEVGMPSDDFEKGPRSEEVGLCDTSVHAAEEDPADGVQAGETGVQLVDDSSSGIKQDTDKVMLESVGQPNNAPFTSAASDLLGGGVISCSSGVPAESTLSSIDVPSSVAQPIMSAASSASSQVDLPKLQFGLFSGPSLIPAPVPAIQIGSIQMPLHLHPPVGQSLTHIHPAPPPMFQFGQLRYPSPISQGILQLAPQSMSFVQPNIHSHYNLSQKAAPMPVHDASMQNVIKEDSKSISADKQSSFVSAPPDYSHESVSKSSVPIIVRETSKNNVASQVISGEVPSTSDSNLVSEPGSQAETKVHHGESKDVLLLKEREAHGMLQGVQASMQPVSSDRNFGGSKTQGPSSSSKGRRYAYAVKNTSMRSTSASGAYSDLNGSQRRLRRTVQRTEFRIRENGDKRQSSSSFNNSGFEDRSYYNGRAVGNPARSGSKRGSVSNKPLKQAVEPEILVSGNIISAQVDSGNKVGKPVMKDALTKSLSSSRSVEENLKRNISHEDVDAPLQSGVVRVFKQPGIETPSDEDDFIEVRSKRQMLNDRREQREKEIKAKSRTTKPSRRPRASRQNAVASVNQNAISAPLVRDTRNGLRSDFVASKGQDVLNKDVSTGFATSVCQPLAPIGTPAVKSESQAVKSPHTGSVSVMPGEGKDMSGLMFDTENKIVDNVTASLSNWGTAQNNKQVMALTQTQLDEAMKPAQFEAHAASVGGHTSTINEPAMSSSSILPKDKSFSSAASPINSLLAGERIQFGAVTSPTVLPPTSRAVHGIGAPGSNRPDTKISHNFSATENECSLFFEKDKHPNGACVHLQDSEAEAEAAASAVAVAAISNDETVGNGLGSGAVSETKSFGGADIEGLTAGMTADQQLGSQSRVEESLSVSLPADLSVETPSISLWPPLPSPQNSSSQMLSHFPGGPPPHFPFYEMNPMLGGPIFAFGPHEDSSGNQSQSQKSTPPSSGPPGTWQQCHSSVDSFYGPPAGFTGPFISPPGGIPGVQGPPHMVVYNHFAPVGQYGQVGLSFMGAYIPSGKQPDWKHNPTSSAIGIGEGEMSNMNVASTQRNPPTMPSGMQHLAPGSPLLPMASPVAMFDVSPFQSAPDMSVQGRWSHVPASPLHSVPLSRPLQQQSDGVLPSQFSHGHPVDHSINANRFPDSRTPKPSENGPAFNVAGDASVTQFPDELSLLDSSRATTNIVGSTQTTAGQSSSASASADAVKSDVIRGGMNNNSRGQNTSSFRTHSSHHKSATGQQNHPMGYNYPRGGGMSQRNTPGGEWSHQRTSFHGRNRSLGAEKGMATSKMKQIYVAKQPTSGT